MENIKILDTDPEERFDRITRLAANFYDMPISVLTLVDANRQWFKSSYGLKINETTRDISFCGHTILSDKFFIIPDALLDPRFLDNPLVTHEPFIRFYAGISLRNEEGYKIGSLAIIDRRPRNLQEENLLSLTDLAKIAETELNSAIFSKHLIERGNLLDAIVDSCPECIKLVDSEGTLVNINLIGARMMGADSLDQLIGKSIYPLVVPKDSEAFKSFVKNVVQGKTGTLEFEIKNLKGRTLFLETHGVPFRNHKNEIAGVLGVTRDITGKKRLEEELRKSMTLESLGLLAGGIAHDFNNILTGVLGNISLAKSLIDSKDQLMSRLNDAEKASMRASDLAQQLLTFAKGGAPIKRVIPIRRVIEHSVQFFLKGSNIQSQLFFQEGLWPVEADEGQISQVFQNLIINAQQAMPAGGTIRVEVKNLEIEEDGGGQILPFRKGNYIEISIQDQGPGISKDHLSKIFDPYFTTKEKGTGLGLSISYSIIDRHKGYITAESTLGAGTTFFVFLPALSQSIIPQEIKEEEAMSRGKGRVLVMDDEEGVLNVARETLKHLGYVVELAKSGTEAVKMYRNARSTSHPFDIVIVDLTVPGDIGGVETLRRLKEIDSQVKVIVSSGYSNSPALAEFKSFGFSECLRKPFRAFEVSEAVKSVLKAGRLEN
ncbi:MAG: response regulator [Nitrospirae bacterium]|nr:response regulator [Nitrospirota bacterium]